MFVLILTYTNLSESNLIQRQFITYKSRNGVQGLKWVLSIRDIDLGCFKNYGYLSKLEDSTWSKFTFSLEFAQTFDKKVLSLLFAQKNPSCPLTLSVLFAWLPSSKWWRLFRKKDTLLKCRCCSIPEGLSLEYWIVLLN